MAPGQPEASKQSRPNSHLSGESFDDLIARITEDHRHRLDELTELRIENEALRCKLEQVQREVIRSSDPAVPEDKLQPETYLPHVVLDVIPEQVAEAGVLPSNAATDVRCQPACTQKLADSKSKLKAFSILRKSGTAPLSSLGVVPWPDEANSGVSLGDKWRARGRSKSELPCSLFDVSCTTPPASAPALGQARLNRQLSKVSFAPSVGTSTIVSRAASISSFEARDYWTRASSVSARVSKMSTNSWVQRGGTSSMSLDSADSANLDTTNAPWAKSGRFILAPSSTERVTWDLASLVLLGYDIIMVPMEAFSPENTWFRIGMDWTSLLFWSGDMIITCFTGYTDKGEPVMNQKDILCNYLKTWFTLDAFVVGFDWCFTILELTQPGSTNAGNVGKLLRALRFARAARLLRLAKLQRAMAMMRDRIDSEIMFIMATVAKQIFLLLIVNHFIGALWYLVGYMGKVTGAENWIDSHGYGDEALMYKYTTSLHWSLTQFTPASMDVQPHNVGERAFAVVVLILGLILFSSFVSSITASITQLRNLQAETTKQFWLLRRYLRQRNVPTSLTFRILRYAEHNCGTESGLVPESRLWVLPQLSDQLRNELQYVTSFSCLSKHPLFEKAKTVSDVAMHRLCNLSLSQKSLAAEEIVFLGGVAGSHMHFVTAGTVQYVKMTTSAEAFPEAPRVVRDCDWLSEAVLWTSWAHVGEARSATDCHLVYIDAAEFGNGARKNPELLKVMSAYARYFAAWLNTLDLECLTDTSDIEQLHKTVACVSAR